MKWHGSRRRYRGAAVLEAALVLPILMGVAFGTIEFGHFFYVKHTLEGAAREGARAGIVASSANANVTAAVAGTMSAAGFNSGQYSVVTSPANVAGVAAGSSVTVTVTMTWGNVGLRPMALIAANKQVTGRAVMRRES
jgi:Flp pilus assembly protein TadG